MGPNSFGVKVRVKFDDFRTSDFNVDRYTPSELSRRSWRYQNSITISLANLLSRWRKSTKARHAFALAELAT